MVQRFAPVKFTLCFIRARTTGQLQVTCEVFSAIPETGGTLHFGAAAAANVDFAAGQS